MLDTPSLFDAMEVGNTEHRVASRRALALAHNRVERNLGRFLRAAKSEEEFIERLALIQEDFDGYVTTASSEVGHEHPEHIAAALKDHYRLAADKVKFVPTRTEEQEEEQEEEVPVTATVTPVITPKTAKKAMKRMAKAGRVWPVVSGIGQALPGPLQDIFGQGQPQGVGQVLPMPGQPPVQPNPDQQPHPNPLEVAGQGAGVGGAAAQMENMGMMGQPGQPPQPPQPPAAPGAPNPNDLQLPNGGNPLSMAGSEGKQGSPLVKDADWGEMQRSEGTHGQPGPMHVQDEYAYNEDPGQACADCGRPLQPHEYGLCERCEGHAFGHPSGGAWEGYVPGDHGPMDSDPYDDERHFPRQGSEEQSRQLVTCPECGGDGKTAGATKCGKCKGEGKVPNFGDSLLDAYFGAQYPVPEVPGDQPGTGGGWTPLGFLPGGAPLTEEQVAQNALNGEGPDPQAGYRAPTNGPQATMDEWQQRQRGARIATDGITDLDGPEPKMDKRKWTPSAPGKPDYEDGSRHPTKEKDVTEVIGPMRNDHELEEIHGQDGHFKNETLPTQTGDTPFAKNNMESGPHTDTFNNDGQVDPVTREALSSLAKPFLAATQRESMGMSAQDFRMLADAIRTAPEGADKSTLAGHVAQYLQHTNPQFDGDRFLQAAIGQPTSGRDNYRGPAVGEDNRGLDYVNPTAQYDNVTSAKADDIYKNPLSDLLSSEFPSDSVVHQAFLTTQN